MANTVKLKRSAVAGKVPTTSDLQLGELAINTYDGKLYLKKDDGTASIVTVNSGGTGTGDVVGPASATDNAITRYDGTTGKLIQNSTVTLDDNGNVNSLNGIAFNTSPTSAPTGAGAMFWDSGDGTPSVILNANTTLQLGQENIAKVYNGSGSTIPNGSVVAVSGAQGQRPKVVLADADSEALSAPTLGIATESIADGTEGFVCTFGLVRELDTSAFTAGQPIYLSSTAGAFTATKPTPPAHLVALGWVVKVNASSGEIFVNINNGWEIEELHNVKVTTPVSGNTLIYDAGNNYWVNSNLTAGTGIGVTNGAGSITIANSGVTSLTAGTGISVSGSTGAVTVTNSAPDQTVALTAGTGISVTGTYPNFTVTNTSPSSGGTVTSVAMTVPTGLSVSGTPITSSGTLALTYSAGYSIPTTASQSNWDTAYSERLQWDGGSTGLVAATGRTSLGGTTVGSNLFTLTNPSAITFPRFNADNTVSALSASSFRTAIGAGTGDGTVTSVAALTLGTTGTDLSSTVATGTTTPVITLNVPTASATNRGALSSADWSTFNGKQAALVSGTNIKTVSGNSLLGAGDVGTIGVAYGGTGQTTYTDGQLLIGNTTGNTLTKSTLTAGSGISITNGSGSITIAATNSGTVTSVGATAPVASSGGTTPTISLNSGYGDTLNPYASKTANYVLAAPNGLAGVPTFRALVSADIPTLNQNTTGSAASLSISGQTGLLTFTGLTTTNRAKTVRDAADTILELGGSYTPTGTWNWTTATVTWPTFNQNTTGTASNVTGTVAIANGGTGQTTKAAAFNALSPVTTLGDIIYGDAANSNTRLAGNTTTTRQFLRQTGTGTVSAAPAWDTVTKTDVGLANVENTALSTWAGSANITTLGTIGTGTWNATTIGVSKGGTGLTSIAALSIPVANTANTYTTVTGTAGQSVRVNAGATAWEAFTPGTVTSVGGTGTVSGLTLTGTVTSSGNLTLGGNLTIAGDMIYDNFTATAGQTTFTTSATYTSGKIQVFVNGCLMVNGADVTVTSGTSVVFGTGLTVGDRVTAVYPT